MRISAVVAAIGLLFIGSRAEDSVVAQQAAVADSVGIIGSALPVQPVDTSTGADIVITSPLCTLGITTEPSGAIVIIDGQKSGASPLLIADVAVGKHTITLQKAGFYRKKVMVDIAATGTTSLHFQLTAPGKLSIVSAPAGALVTLNGTERGTTPFTDSLLTPGIYRFSLYKDQYDRIDDSVTVTSGGISMYNRVLTISDSIANSPKRPVAGERKRNKRANLLIIGGAFLLFLITLASIESQE